MADPENRRRGGLRRLGRPPAPLPPSPAGAGGVRRGAAAGAARSGTVKAAATCPPLYAALATKNGPTGDKNGRDDPAPAGSAPQAPRLTPLLPLPTPPPSCCPPLAAPPAAEGCFCWGCSNQIHESIRPSMSGWHCLSATWLTNGGKRADRRWFGIGQQSVIRVTSYSSILSYSLSR